MSKKFLTFGILIVVLSAIMLPAVFVHAGGSGVDDWNDATADNETTNDSFGWLVDGFFKAFAYFLMQVTSWILGISGLVLDLTVKFTILHMSDNIGDGSSLGPSITNAWKALRDVANMCFIFVLLYTALKAMFQLSFGGIQTTIRNIIIVALLINFSLFFSKVIIDASNIVAVGFYNEMANSGQLGTGEKASISNGYQKMLKVQTTNGDDVLDMTKGPIQILMVGVVSSIITIILSLIFFIFSIMLVARFVILIFLMILSPLALIAFIIPKMSGKFHEWLDALVNQSFFVPLFFALLWVTFKIGNPDNLMAALKKGAGPGQVEQFASALTDPGTTLALLLNYVLILGFSIAALIFAKSMATKGAAGTAFKTISAGIGTVAVGSTAWAGRKSFGLVGDKISKNAWLQESANKDRKGFRGRVAGGFSRLGLYTAEKARDATFDVRNATIPTSVVGDAIRGTVGRTKAGKALGLNDVNIPSVGVGSLGVNTAILGKAGTKGYKQAKAESDKRVQERDAIAKSEWEMAKKQNDIKKGAKAAVGSPEYQAMEKALASLSDKQTETLVANNRELLNSLNFANAISVKQLEAINKSDQFSEYEKNNFKNNRFKEIEDIDDAAGLAALAIPVAMRTPAQAVAAARVQKARDRVKGLADSELEMINSNYINPSTPEGREFISQLKQGQVDTINKSGKFSSAQKNDVQTERLRPLINAITSGNTTLSQSLVRGSDIKTKVGYMKPKGTPPIIIATHPDILPIYTPKMLQRMANHDDMSDSDIHTLRSALLGPTGMGAPGVSTGTITWLIDSNKGALEFP